MKLAPAEVDHSDLESTKTDELVLSASFVPNHGTLCRAGDQDDDSTVVLLQAWKLIPPAEESFPGRIIVAAVWAVEACPCVLTRPCDEQELAPAFVLGTCSPGDKTNQ